MFRCLALVALTAAACGEHHDSFRLHIGWRETGVAACPIASGDTASCRDIPIACDVRVRVRIIGERAEDPSYSECFRIEGASDACALRDLAIEPRAVPAEDVRIQVTMWTDAELARHGYAPDDCPEAPRFVDGVPALEPDAPMPALGGESRASIGEGSLAGVELGCPSWYALDDAECRADRVTIEAHLRDLASGALAGELQIGVGVPHQVGGDHVLDLVAPDVVTATPGVVTRWSAVVDRSRDACVQVASTGAAPAVRCVDASTLDWPVAPLDVYAVSPALLDTALSRVGRRALPPKGFVMGVVLDEAGLPVAGAHVAASDDVVAYLAGGDATGADGLFVATSAPFDSVWHATAPNGLGTAAPVRGGLIAGHVTVIVLQLAR